MHTIMARPARPVTAGTEEPEPQHDRDTGNPDSMPPLPVRVPGASLGLIEDLEREDDRRGFETEPDPVTQLHGLVRHLRRDGDHRAAAAGRRALRTRAEQEPRLTPRVAA